MKNIKYRRYEKMKRKKYYKVIDLELNQGLYEYLLFKSDKLDTSISEIVRSLVMEDINNNGIALLINRDNLCNGDNI
jgi:hypothetical protein